MELRVAGAQMPVTNEIAANVATIREMIERAAAAGAEILLTPEGSLSGYRHDFDPAAARAALTEVTAFAQERSVGLALGTCSIEDDGLCYNQIRFYRPDGAYLGFHAKTLRCGTMEAAPKGEINHYAERALQTFSWTPALTIGGLICNDVWANPECTPMPDPHLSQQLAERGAQVIFHAVNGGRDGGAWSEVAWRFHEANLQMRARAGRLFLVTVDNCHPQTIPCSAPSGVVGPEGNWVCRTDAKGAQLFVHTLRLPAG